MTQKTSTSVQELETILADLPADKVQEVVDFASYLRHRYSAIPQRGSATAILHALEKLGPLEFEEGELDALLDEIEAMRQMDMRDHG
ncbi:MAG: DUF2281 domain-containing protein [Chloroflexota bacterium]|nr:DUF2281 domain-containing protein [Chloroflexota bacterium]